MRIKLFLAACALAVGLSNAKATSFIDIVNSSGGGTNTRVQEIVGAGVQFAIGTVRLNLDAGSRAFISYIFEGKNAGYRNQLLGPGRSWMIDNRAPSGTTVVTEAGAGLLDFGFRANGVGPVFHNGGNHVDQPVQWGVVLDTSGRSGWLLFDDGASGRNFDYDDMVVRFNLSTQPVPEASTVAMLLSGLGVLAVFGWQRRRTAR